MKISYTDDKLECGLDEAGAGCLAGPVVASAVILPNDLTEFEYLDLKLIRDSKKLSEANRYKAKYIIEDIALDYKTVFISESEIDQINILNARIKAMHNAIKGLSILPDLLLVDGNRFKRYTDIDSFQTIDHICIEKGDSLYMSIASASILSKVIRDEFMIELAKEFPMYHWERNKGYGTKDHYQSIYENGVSTYHRKSFNLHLY